MSSSVATPVLSISAAGSSSLYAIDKLNSSNFNSWKFRLTMILMDRGLWEYVDGSQVAPMVTAVVSAEAEAKADEWPEEEG